MTPKITIYQKPTCSKCREAVKLLKDRGADFEAVNYFEKPLTKTKLEELLRKLDLSPREILRKDESVARDLHVRDMNDEELLDAMARHPDLIQRPIVVKGEKAVLGRPVANLEKLL